MSGMIENFARSHAQACGRHVVARCDDNVVKPWILGEIQLLLRISSACLPYLFHASVYRLASKGLHSAVSIPFIPCNSVTK